MPELQIAQLASFQHIWSPGEGQPGGGPILLLLHGTGTDERDLLPLGALLAPGAARLSPRGRVLENGYAPRFFRRLAEGVFDEDDIRFRARELSRFLDHAAAEYHFDRSRVIAVGFSNGANIAAAMLLLHGANALAGAILLAPMLPLTPPQLPDLSAVPIFIGAGRQDPLVSPQETERLAALLKMAKAPVTLHWHPGGHTITQDELVAARQWLQAAWPGIGHVAPSTEIG